MVAKAYTGRHRCAARPMRLWTISCKRSTAKASPRPRSPSRATPAATASSSSRTSTASTRQQVTKDNTHRGRALAGCPGTLALYYTSYKLNHPDIFYHDLATGARKVFARYGGSNISPAVSPDGTKVAMILSKDGWTDLYVCDADGCDLKRLTKSPEDESSPCWSPDGKWICFAAKIKERRSLCKDLRRRAGRFSAFPPAGC